MNNRLDQLKRQYLQIPIPDELDDVVDHALNRKKRSWVHSSRWISYACATVLVFLISINASTSIANAFAEVPGFGWIKVLTVREYIVNDGKHAADIQVPGLVDLSDRTLELGLNEQYLAEGQKLYEQFQKDMEEMKGGYLGVDAGYFIKTDTDDIFAIARYVVISMGSSEEHIKYDTIDKKNQILLTLPMLFKNNQYVDVISQYIKEQMGKKMAADPNIVYWLEEDTFVDSFEGIRPDQSFYLNADSQLVIAFDKYEVGPGYMGSQEFVIPTSVIADILVSDQYIK